MTRFPEGEPAITMLAQSIVAGLAQNPTLYAASPVSSDALKTLLTQFLAAQQASIQAQAAARQATTTKNNQLQQLTDAMRQVLRYAENTVGFNDVQLKLLGWGGRAARIALEPPGQPTMLEAPQRGAGWITLTWNEPNYGGKVAAYNLQRREQQSSVWHDVGTALETSITLTDQTRGEGFEYRVVALNKAGKSNPSNIVEATL